MSGERRGPSTTAQAEADRQARQAREAEALRANLRRRKDQLRARVIGVVHDRVIGEAPQAHAGVENNVVVPSLVGSEPLG